jgi:hypothetical protein
MKSENEILSNDLYHARRAAEEYRQSVEILQAKLQNSEQVKKEATEAASSLRSAKSLLEGQLKVLNEQVDMLQKAHEDLSMKKQTE